MAGKCRRIGTLIVGCNEIDVAMEMVEHPPAIAVNNHCLFSEDKQQEL